MGMRKTVLLFGAMLAALVLTMAGPVSKQLVSPRPVEAAPQPSPKVVTVENGAGADNARIQNAINNARGKPITILLRAGSKEAGTCYSTSGPIDLASNVTIDSKSAPARWCMVRATPPRTQDSPPLRWFRVTGKAVHNFTLLNANLYGLGPGGVSFEEQESYVDFGLVFIQVITDPQDASRYSKNLRLEHVTFDKFYGVCVFTRYVDGINFDDVDCNDSTKGGLVFSYGSRNGFVRNSTSTLTGDDAMAFNSGGGSAGEALVTNFDVQGVHLTQEQDDRGCGTLCFRGATNIRVGRDDISGRDSDIGAGSGVGTVRIRDSIDSAHAWNSGNIELSASIVRPDDDESGVYVTDPGASDIRITDNSITYTPPKCGILLSEGVPVSEVTISGNTFTPDGPYNVCLPASGVVGGAEGGSGSTVLP
jgi:hypothetical protein